MRWNTPNTHLSPLRFGFYLGKLVVAYRWSPVCAYVFQFMQMFAMDLQIKGSCPICVCSKLCHVALFESNL